MIIRDLHNFRHRFYELVKKEKHTTIFVNLDVDALCACYILMHAFNCDHVSYTVNPIDSWTTLQNSLLEYCAHSSYIILINCGAYRSFLSIDLPENVTVFVIDSMRPFHLDNIFSRDAIQLLAYSYEIESWNLPRVEDVYAPSESDESEENDDDEENDSMRERARIADRIVERAMKRKQRAQWKRNKTNIMFEYYIKTWYSTPVSIMMLELVHELNKCDARMMWCAAVGLSSQLSDQIISMESYNKICVDRMRPFIRKYSPRNQQVQGKGDDVMKISFEPDLILPFYSHWSLYDSMTNDVYFSCQSKLWTQKGSSNLRHVIATLGLTLNECRQSYLTMPIDRRKEVFKILENHLGLNFATFSSHFGYAKQFNAFDFARALSLRLECQLDSKETFYDRFMATRFILDKFLTGECSHDALSNAIQNYKLALRAITSMVFIAISQSHVINCSSYFLLVAHESPDSIYLTSKHCLFSFAHFTQRAFASSRNARRAEKPFVVAAPLRASNEGWFWVAGLMPIATYLSENEWKSIFRRVFEHVSESSNISIKKDIIMLKSEDRTKFFNSLDAILEASDN